MVLDAATRRNLELTQSQLEGSRAKSLVHILDKTITPLGGRKLRNWLDQPLLDIERIRGRHQAAPSLAAMHSCEAIARRLRGVARISSV